MAAVLNVTGVSKRFDSLLANDNISFELNNGEILGLLGENGAGKTTLMNILTGSYVADSGTVMVSGKPLKPGSTRASLDAGIAMVHQHFALAVNLSVIDNITVGVESLLSWKRNLSYARKRLAEIAEQCGFVVPLDAKVSSLSVGERQKIEIIKALYLGAEVLILDEPTAVLTPQEADSLFAALRKLAEQGLGVIIISHKLKEIMAVCDRIGVLRQGSLVLEIKREEANIDELALAMVGYTINRPSHDELKLGKPLLELNSVGVGVKNSNPISFTLHQHEIIGITGVAGNGQQELSAVLNGITPPLSGSMRCLDKDGWIPAVKMNKLGIGRIPADRHLVGIIGDMSVAENLISNQSPSFCKFGFLNGNQVVQHATEMINTYDIRCSSANSEARLLSGGNIQKLIIARELNQQPKIIIACQPTRGLDVGAINEVHNQLLTARKNGSGIILITEDLDELFALADRVGVMFKGSLSDFAPAADLSATQIGLMMSGA